MKISLITTDGDQEMVMKSDLDQANKNIGVLQIMVGVRDASIKRLEEKNRILEMNKGEK